MNEYLQQLISFYVNALQAGNQKVDVILNCEPLALSSKKAVPIGLIVNELVTNAYKYAFPENYENGKINILLKSNADGTASLNVKDNGPHSDQNIGKEGFGSKLIKALTSQLGGKLEWQKEQGHCYSITFNII